MILAPPISTRTATRFPYTTLVRARTTRTAAETFETRSGNCLSLVILTAALARPLNIDVRYRFVPRARTWTRTQGMVLQNGHVNIELSPRATIAGSGIQIGRAHV